MATVEIPREFGFVIIGQIASFVTLQLLSGPVMKARKRLNVQYPNLYAVPGVHEKADEFNRIQRGHQNALETYSSYAILNLITGLKYPIVAAVLAGFWCFGRLMYRKGYEKDPKARYEKGGSVHWIGTIGSLIGAGVVAFNLLMG
eukprot:NODE_2477_length_563_cov_165.463303_g2427_i0.p1 GENE.NODE_2477_length_563_cov_165.463303_g2427_i0~~NODE_2477_length_563_cov_165.463303_g2427_i0.p1  ORF type:complete len:145 (-),score=24.33 NODE_2477_length_563_cov_165.463303_g2427_i0:50-484(-)